MTLPEAVSTRQKSVMLLNTGDKEKRICIEKGKIGINSINILVIFSLAKVFNQV